MDAKSNNNNNDSNWYASRKEIEENSPSRRDGVSLKKETNLRKLYSYFLKELGKLLRVPQITISTAAVYCQRFFTRQSHAKNDCLTIATVCMFLAGKVEETPQPLEKVIYISYKMRHKSDPSALENIKKKEVYEPQKDLILSGEKLVLSTLGFDLRAENPYVPLSIALKKFNYALDPLAQVAWNILNDGLCTSLCLQYKAQHIAAGAIFLSAKFAKVKLPSNAEEPWWHEFDVTPCQLEDISNQVMELYDQSRLAASGVAGSSGGGADHSKITPSNSGDNAITVDSSLVIKAAQVHDDQIHTKNQNNENMGADSKLQGQAVVDRGKEFFVNETEPNFRCRETAKEVSNVDAALTEKGEDTEASEWKNESLLSTSGRGGNQNFNSGKASKPDIPANIDEDNLRDAVVGSSTSCCQEDRCNQ